MWWLRMFGNERGAVGPAKDPTEATVEGADEEDSEEGSPSRQGGVQVDLKEDAGKTPAAKGEKAEGEDPGEPKWKKALENQLAASRRVQENLQKQLASLQEALKRPASAPAPTLAPGATAMPPGTPQAVINEYDQLVDEGKWIDAVRRLGREVSREEYKKFREEERVEEQLHAHTAHHLGVLEKSKQRVEALYPTLHRETGDEAAVESQLFQQAQAQLVQEDPQIEYNPHAPELIMSRMEQLAAEQGVSLARSTTKGAAPARPAPRGVATTIPASRGVGGAVSYTLTPEQREWCDTYLSHLPEAERYKNYARIAKAAEKRGGVEA